MFLVVHLQATEGETQEISFYSTQFGDCVNMLNALTSSYKIQDVTLIEDQHELSLPVDAFDGDTEDATVIAQLKQQWEKLLYIQ